MSGPRVWVYENDLRLVMELVELLNGEYNPDNAEPSFDVLLEAVDRVRVALDPPPLPPLQPYIACMQGHGA